MPKGGTMSIGYRNNNADERQTGFCAYCHGEYGTSEHIPSKVFLDKPYPDDLPVIFTCKDCNGGFSSDEEYVACLIECAKCNTCDINKLERESIKKTLSHSPALLARISESSIIDDGKLMFKAEDERVQNVLIKLARGHLLYEFNEQIFDEEPIINWCDFTQVPDEERLRFESLMELTKMPEAGCRACSNVGIFNEQILCLPWLEVQKSRYRYLVNYNGGYLVRIVINEYLACEVFYKD